MLFAGDSGSGKSTIATYLIKKDFGFIGEDTVLPREKHGLHIYSFSLFLSLSRRKDVDYFLENKNLRQIGKDYLWFKENDKFFLNIIKFKPNLLIKSAPVRLVLFLVLSNRIECRIKRVSTKEALDKFARQVSNICEDKEKLQTLSC